MGNCFISRSGGGGSLWYEVPTMTPLLACSIAAGMTGDWSMAPPRTLGGKDKSFFGRRSAPLEILATWARLRGTKTTTRKSGRARAERIQLLRLFMPDLQSYAATDASATRLSNQATL